MRVVLVHPAGSNWVPGQRDVTVVANRMPPIGILSMAAFARRRGIDVRVVDCLGPGAKATAEDNARVIVELEPDLVGFSTTTSAFLDAHDMACAVKAARPAARTLFGGVHVSALGRSLLERFDAIDYLAPGEGELTLAELAEGRPPGEVDGVIFRDADGSIVETPEREKVRDLDSLPFPAFDLLEGFPERYHLPLFSYVRSPGATMITSRGCLYQCSYCDRSVFRRGFRQCSAEYIYEQMRFLRRRFGVRHITIYDDLFTTRRRRVRELCERLARRPLGVEWNCAVRVGHVDDELLDLLVAGGCLMVSVGVESGDPELLERHKAGVTVEEVRETVARLKRRGLRVKGLFMMGLPGESEASVRRTSDLVLSLDLDDMNMTKFTPFPGAPCFATVRDEGTFVEDWRLMNCLNFVFVPEAIGSKARLEELYNEHIKRFYTSRRFRRRFLRRLWDHRHSLARVAADLPSILAAKRQFEPGRRRAME